MDERTIHLLITGRVQGVGYRDWMIHRATALGLRGSGLFSILGGGALVLVLALFVYSYLVWRTDPDRRTNR